MTYCPEPLRYTLLPYVVPSDGHLRVEAVTPEPSYAYLVNNHQAMEWRRSRSCWTLASSETALKEHVVERFELQPGDVVFLLVTPRLGDA